MNTEENQYLFDQYLLGELTPEEKVAFEQKITEEEAFKKEFQDYQEFSKQVELAFLKEDLEKIHQKVIAKPRNLFNSSFLKIAASIAIFSAIAIIWINNNSQNNSQLFNKYFIKDPGLPTVMSASNALAFEKAMVQYKQENYKNAREIWLELNPKNDTLQFYIAMSYLNEKNFSQTKKWLNAEEINTSSSFYNDAIWYNALIFLNEGKKEKALVLLHQIEDYPKVKELIAQIEQE